MSLKSESDTLPKTGVPQLVSLWQHQLKATELALKQRDFGLLFEMGTGKTLSVINILRHRFAQYKKILRTLIISPPITLENWKREWERGSKVGDKVAIAYGHKKKRLETIGSKPILITNYESLIMPEFFQKLWDWAPEVIVYDECFAEGTLVDTPTGPLPIETLNEGDLVLNCLGIAKIKRRVSKSVFSYALISFNGIEVRCSLNHKWLTPFGWKATEDLKVGDEIISTKKAVQILQEGLGTKKEKVHLLFSTLLSEVDARQYRCGGQNRDQTFGTALSMGEEKDANRQPNVEDDDPKKSLRSPPQNRAQTEGSWRKWYRHDSGGKRDFSFPWQALAVEFWDIFRRTTKRIPERLQSRLWFARKKDSNRGGRIFSQRHSQEETRFEKRKEVEAIRVVNISFHQQGGLGEPLQFWDLEIEGHPSFSVGGVLVHNCQRIKDYRSKRTKAAVKLSTTALHRYILTGTPILNSPVDIFTQFQALDCGETFGNNFYAFRNRYLYDANAHMPRDRHFPNWKIRPGALEEINELIYKKAMRVTKEECLDLPPLVKETVYVELSAEQRRAYEEMKKDFITYIKDKACVATIALTKALKLMQITTGFVAIDEVTKVDLDNSPRISALKELLEALTPDHKVIVWAVFKHNYEAIRKVCSSLRIQYVEVHGEISSAKKFEAVDTFNNDPSCRVFIGHPGSGGIGISLISSDYSVYFSRNFSLENDIQSESRNHRGGSEKHKKITRIDIVAKDTIDEAITKALASKLDISDKVLRDLSLEL